MSTCYTNTLSMNWIGQCLGWSCRFHRNTNLFCHLYRRFFRKPFRWCAASFRQTMTLLMLWWIGQCCVTCVRSCSTRIKDTGRTSRATATTSSVTSRADGCRSCESIRHGPGSTATLTLSSNHITRLERAVAGVGGYGWSAGEEAWCKGEWSASSWATVDR